VYTYSYDDLRNYARAQTLQSSVMTASLGRSSSALLGLINSLKVKEIVSRSGIQATNKERGGGGGGGGKKKGGKKRRSGSVGGKDIDGEQGVEGSDRKSAKSATKQRPVVTEYAADRLAYERALLRIEKEVGLSSNVLSNHLWASEALVAEMKAL
jgi:hypothetical protein